MPFLPLFVEAKVTCNSSYKHLWRDVMVIVKVSDKIAASEGLITYHTVHNDQSFCTNNYLLTLMKKLCGPNFLEYIPDQE